MNYNITLQEYRIKASGSNAMKASSWQVNTERQSPSYVSDIDYYSNFASNTSTEATQNITTNNASNGSYSSHINLYGTKTNLFPDDLDSKNAKINKWESDNQRSLLYKTRDLFHKGKIKSLISRFSTNGNGDTATIGKLDTASEYGMSHGNGLLKKDAESGYSATGYNRNGYNNPYCRVWTHHWQYDSISKLIRPFNSGDEDSPSALSLTELHKWSNFEDSTNNNNDSTTKYGWKSGEKGWENSVLNKNGFVNITPKYKGGGDLNTHTKQCMFSIENLAWQGYDPYSFEKALSWEQRGPLGGRIMWFPPYGITFNETTQASWTNHTFIGRGEDVYTYTNTTRTGNLSFMLVVDHPSVLDYASWQTGSENSIKDTNVLRFFAGCDYSTLKDAAKPMPLTDEYIEDTTDYDEYITPDLAPIPDEPDDEPIDTVKTINFYVFYPNNYSGYYDGLGEDVEAVAYLLDGIGTQKSSDNTSLEDSDDTSLEDSGDTSLWCSDELIKFEEIDGSGNGYEMGSAMNETDCPIIGSKITWDTAIKNKVSTYQYDTSKQWHYRIDGKYEIPGNSDKYYNCYDQTLLISANYQDTQDYLLNFDYSVVQSVMSSEEEDLYSFAEVAAAIMAECVSEGNANTFMENKHFTDDMKERVETLRDVLNNYTLSSINAVGFSNSHGNNSSSSTNDIRNENLARERSNTIIKWLIKYLKESDDKIGTIELECPSSTVSIQNISDKEAKKYRSALIRMEFNKSDNTTVSETEQTVTYTDDDSNDITVSTGIQKYIGYTSSTDANGTTYYIGEDSDGNPTYWVEVESGSKQGQLKRVEIINNVVTEIDKSSQKSDTERGSYDTTTGTTGGQNNSIRYDKEYYFFKELEMKSPIMYDKLMKKIQYFDPAYHSMSPEGFNARLTFLQQCTRQGNTIGASDNGAKTASNLAFGKPPFCVLRLGDFYNQMIVIDNISINYESLWDLNPEGIGVQPMIANVNISFKFIGGGDLGGPIRRLQNAMTFNYYSNARLYDNRADRITYNWDSKTGGAIDHEINEDSSYYYSTQMYNKDEE